MKNYEEMSRDVLHRIDRYEDEQRRKKAKITKVLISATPVCAAAVVGVGLWKGGAFTPNHTLLTGSTIESTVSDSNAIVTEKNTESDTAQNKKNSVVVSENGDTSIESNTDTADISSVNTNSDTAKENAPAVSENSQTVTNDKPSNSPAQQTEPNEQSAPIESITPSNGNNGWFMQISSIDWNGITYYSNDMANISAYTQDKYIGKVSDFTGEYKDDAHYYISPNDSVYTVKETADVLFVVKSNGKIVVLSTRDWSLERNEPERLEADYVDPNTVPYESVQNFNVFCN